MKYYDPKIEARNDWITILLLIVWLLINSIFIEPDIYLTGSDWDQSVLKYFIPSGTKADDFFPEKEDLPINALVSWSYENNGLVMWSSFPAVKALFQEGYYGARFPKPFVLECVLDDAAQFHDFCSAVDTQYHYSSWSHSFVRHGEIYILRSDEELLGIYLNMDEQILRFLYVDDWDSGDTTYLDQYYSVFGGGGHHPAHLWY